MLRAALFQSNLVPELRTELSQLIIWALAARNIGDFLSVFLNGYALDSTQTGPGFLLWGETAFPPFADR